MPTLLPLDDEETTALQIALETHLHRLRAEYASSDLHEFRARLRRTLDTLERVAARLDGLVQAEADTPSRG